MKAAILAPGASMNQAVADGVRAYPIVVAVNNVAIETKSTSGEIFPALAPWASALAAQDAKWWRVNPAAKLFAGRKFSTNRIDGVEQIKCLQVQNQSSSGVLAIEVARRLGGTEMELYGFDMKGAHYFGKHAEPLRNTTPERFAHFQVQFLKMKRFLDQLGIVVINKTPGSALKAFSFG